MTASSSLWWGTRSVSRGSKKHPNPSDTRRTAFQTPRRVSRRHPTQRKHRHLPSRSTSLPQRLQPNPSHHFLTVNRLPKNRPEQHRVGTRLPRPDHILHRVTGNTNKGPRHHHPNLRNRQLPHPARQIHPIRPDRHRDIHAPSHQHLCPSARRPCRPQNIPANRSQLPRRKLLFPHQDELHTLPSQFRAPPRQSLRRVIPTRK